MHPPASLLLSQVPNKTLTYFTLNATCLSNAVEQLRGPEVKEQAASGTEINLFGALKER